MKRIFYILLFISTIAKGQSFNARVNAAGITTVGTIGTGTWQGTLIGATYGGTGVNNGSSTITLAGNFITSGAFATTLTSTATTNATLPAGTNTLYSTLASSITSAQLLSSVTNETGSGVLVFATSPALTTPDIGVATATSLNKVTITAPGTSATLTLITGSSLITAGAFALTLTSTATSNATIPAGTNTLYSTLASSITSAQMLSSVTNETGTGVMVFGTSPTFTTQITLPTGTTGAVPVLFVSGTNATSAVAGGMEYDGTNWYQTNSTAVRGVSEKTRVLTTSAGTLSMSATYSDIVGNGTTSTWTLPAVSGTTNVKFFLKNIGSGTITVNAAAAANEIYTTSAVNTYALTAGSAVILTSNGTFWTLQ